MRRLEQRILALKHRIRPQAEAESVVAMSAALRTMHSALRDAMPDRSPAYDLVTPYLARWARTQPPDLTERVAAMAARIEAGKMSLKNKDTLAALPCTALAVVGTTPAGFIDLICAIDAML